MPPGQAPDRSRFRGGFQPGNGPGQMRQADAPAHRPVDLGSLIPELSDALLDEGHDGAALILTLLHRADDDEVGDHHRVAIDARPTPPPRYGSILLATTKPFSWA